MLQLTSAIDTKIKVTTYANHDISIDFLTASPMKLIKTMKMSSGTGETSFVYSSAESKFNMNVFVLNQGQKIINARFDDNAAGEPIHLILFPTNKTIIKDLPEEIPNIINETNNTQVELSLNQSQNNSLEDKDKLSLTGSATEGTSSSVLSGKSIYYIGAIVLLAIIVIVFISIKKKSAPKELKVRKLSELKSESPKAYKKEAEQAEKKVEEMQKELNRYKNQDKIKQIEARISQEQEEVRRLRRGY